MTSGQKRALIFVGAILFAFGAGAGWQFLRASALQQQLRETQRTLAFRSLEATLGAATLEAQRGSHEISRQLASEFFTGLQSARDMAPAAAQQRFDAILNERDAVITALSRGDPDVGTRLAYLFLQFRSGTREFAADSAGEAQTPYE